MPKDMLCASRIIHKNNQITFTLGHEGKQYTGRIQNTIYRHT